MIEHGILVNTISIICGIVFFYFNIVWISLRSISANSGLKLTEHNASLSTIIFSTDKKFRVECS